MKVVHISKDKSEKQKLAEALADRLTESWRRKGMARAMKLKAKQLERNENKKPGCEPGH